MVAVCLRLNVIVILMVFVKLRKDELLLFKMLHLGTINDSGVTILVMSNITQVLVMSNLRHLPCKYQDLARNDDIKIKKVIFFKELLIPIKSKDSTWLPTAIAYFRMD